MSLLIAYLAVFVLAATPWLEVLLVVPAGIVAGLPAVPTAAVATVGNVATLIPVVYAGDRIRAWWRRRRGRDIPATSARSGRAARVFDRYGLPGLALLGPLLTGVHVAALVGIAAGAPRRASVVWLSAGVAVWAAIAAVATVVGIDAFVDTERVPDVVDGLGVG